MNSLVWNIKTKSKEQTKPNQTETLNSEDKAEVTVGEWDGSPVWMVTGTLVLWSAVMYI